MRVHQLDESLKATKEQVLKELRDLGHSVNAVSGVDDEAQVLLVEKFGTNKDAALVVGQILKDKDVEDRYHKVVGFLKDGAPDTIQMDLSPAPEVAEPTPEVDESTEETEEEVTVSEDEQVLESDSDGDEAEEISPAPEVAEPTPEVMSEIEAFPLVCDRGQHKDWFNLDLDRAEKFGEAIGERKIRSATFHADRDEIRAVTWPDYQKVVVRCG